MILRRETKKNLKENKKVKERLDTGESKYVKIKKGIS